MLNNNDYKRKQSSAFQSMPKQLMEFQDLEGFLKHFLAPISTTLVSIDISFVKDMERKASINGRNVTFEITDAKKEKKNKAGVFSLQQESDLTLAVTHDVSLNFVQSQSGKYEIFLNANASALGLVKPEEIKNMEITLRQAEKLIALVLNHRNQAFAESNCINNFKEYQIFNFLEEDLFENLNQPKGEIFSKNYKKMETQTVAINHYLGDLLKTSQKIRYFEKLHRNGGLFAANLLAPEEKEFLDNILDQKGLSGEIGKKTYNELFLDLKKEFLTSGTNSNKKVSNIKNSNKIPKERLLSLWADEPNIEDKMPTILKLASQEEQNLRLNANKPLELKRNGYTKTLSNLDYGSKIKQGETKPFIRICDRSLKAQGDSNHFTMANSGSQSKILKPEQANSEVGKGSASNQKNQFTPQNKNTIETGVMNL